MSEICDRCHTPKVEDPVLVDTGMEYELLCGDCAAYAPGQEDEPPADLYTCPSCQGRGEIATTQDSFGVWQTALCVACGGSGEWR